MASETPSIAVVGCGYWGKNIVRNFAQLGELGAVSDPYRPNAEAMTSLYGAPTRSLDEILIDPKVMGVAIAAPAPLHAEIACKCLEAGKHVFVEKPIALSLSDAQRMVDAGVANNRLVMVGHLLNYHPAFLKVVEIVGSGELGNLRRIYSNRLSLGKVRTDENVMWSFAPHDVSMILRLAGKVPSRVDAHGAAYLSPGIQDFTHLHMQFDDGMTAHVFTSWLHPFKEQKLVVVGDKGMVVFDDTLPDNKKVALYKHAINIGSAGPEIAKADVEYVAFNAGEPLRNECQAFLDAIAGRTTLYTDGEEGMRVLDVLSRAQTALEASSMMQGAA